jgi:pimeloyl-ACP methyl ester carboxylesterase
MTTSPDIAARLWKLWNDNDIVDLLPRVTVPTLVLHSRHNDVSPFSEWRRIAVAIPNARFVGLDSENHIPMPGEPAWDQFTSAIEEFLLDHASTLA